MSSLLMSVSCLLESSYFNVPPYMSSQKVSFLTYPQIIRHSLLTDSQNDPPSMTLKFKMFHPQSLQNYNVPAKIFTKLECSTQNLYKIRKSYLKSLQNYNVPLNMFSESYHTDMYPYKTMSHWHVSLEK